MLVGLGMLLFCIIQILAPSLSTSEDLHTSEKDIQYKSYIQKSSIVHTLLIPVQSRLRMTVVSSKVDFLENFAQKYQAIAVLNGGFFDPVNYKSTSYVVRQGKIVADPRLNERLISNPKLTPYIDKILNRTELRQYQCRQTVRYDIAFHHQPIPEGCQLVNALGGGPRLLPEITLQQEGFVEASNGRIVRDALGSQQPNARTAVGITPDGSIVWVMVAQKPDAPANGMTLPELAKFMKTIGVESAMNLDGGSSSALYYQGKTFYGKFNAKGKQVKRPVKSILLVQENN